MPLLVNMINKCYFYVGIFSVMSCYAGLMALNLLNLTSWL